MAVIGEMFEEPNVVGIGMAIRSREDLLSVWNEDNSNDEVGNSLFYVDFSTRPAINRDYEMPLVEI